MNQDIIKLLFSLLRSAVCGEMLSEEDKSLCNGEILAHAMLLAQKHDLVHLLAVGLKKNGILYKNNAMLEKEILKAIYRSERRSYELENLCKMLETAKIPFIPLKGAVMRNYYPEEWMRTSCDIDVLVRETDVDKAAEILTEQCGYTYGGKHTHDIAMDAPNGIHIELHYIIIEDGRVSRESSDVLKRVFETTVLCDGFEYWHEMTDEMFYFYHITHMANHFNYYGCGIRPFVDLWLLNHRVEFDAYKRKALLDEGKLTEFAKQSEYLSEVWFGRAEYTETAKMMEEYILRGGAYGSNENRIVIQQHEKGGKLQYALSKIFIPYDVIKTHYRVLEKHKWLMPIMEVRRWGKLIFCGHMQRSLEELEYNNNLPKDTAKKTRELMDKLGL